MSPAEWPVCVLTCPMCPGLGHVSPGTVLSTQYSRAGKYLIKTSADQELFRTSQAVVDQRLYLPTFEGVEGGRTHATLPPATCHLGPIVMQSCSAACSHHAEYNVPSAEWCLQQYTFYQ